MVINNTTYGIIVIGRDNKILLEAEPHIFEICGSSDLEDITSSNLPTLVGVYRCEIKEVGGTTKSFENGTEIDYDIILSNFEMIDLNKTDDSSLINKSIAVICLDYHDFQLWKVENGMVGKGKINSVVNYGTKFLAISKPEDLIGHSFDDVIETNYSKNNKKYNEINDLLKVSLKQNNFI